MLQKLVVKNFRCFRELAVGPLARINLIAGMNNTGKTALLEAIQLHNNPNNPQVALELHLHRGIAEPMQANVDVIGWLSHDRQSAGGTEVSSSDEHARTHTLWISVGTPLTLRSRFPEVEKFLQGGVGGPFSLGNELCLVLIYREPGSADQFSILVSRYNAGLSWIGAQTPWSIPSVYLGSGVRPSDQDINFFGELEASKRVDEILPAIRIVEPRLQRLAPLPLAGTWTIHGDIGLSRLVPVPFMGEGTRRLLSFVLAIFNAPGGVVLIDEIENGLHYSVMKKVWQAVAEAARKADAQVFATTHSWECLRWAQEAFAEQHRADFRVHRLDRRNGEITVTTYTPEMVESALFHGLEMR